MLKAVAKSPGRSGMAWFLGLALLVGAAGGAEARGPLPQQQATQLETIAVAELPPQGRTTYALIRQGGPFPFDTDGVVFGNRERILPRQPRGYYREYTVRTPGSRDRGARRIVCGGAPTVPDACYYSGDHYASFRQIVAAGR
ncbi:ribonuclease [Xylophilus sp.]|uniref:ribonuclease n=1 Tax=Xylophilus sp. TaxID=2653893 RepID=UPI0013BA2E99|nr:ribonuclease [Xylophilus sp.]KAF1044080.1 MAG: Guanyl-specific ribonuclease Sa [Xylophilus sp.]